MRRSGSAPPTGRAAPPRSSRPRPWCRSGPWRWGRSRSGRSARSLPPGPAARRSSTRRTAGSRTPGRRRGRGRDARPFRIPRGGRGQPRPRGDSSLPPTRIPGSCRPHTEERPMPPRAMWKGAISFGLVTIPVAVYPANEEKSLKFNQLHDEDMGRIRYKRVCSVDGEEVDFEHIVKGYEIEKDKYVVLDDEDFDAVPVESSRAIDIQQFVELDEIDPILFKKSYYLVPDETGAKAYALLRQALSEENKVGIAKVSFRDKEHLSALRFKEDVFVLETMYWPDEVRAAEFDTVPADEKVRDNEVEMARSLIDSLTEPWNPGAFTDEYREALLEIVEKKAAGEPIEAPSEEAPARVVDLMEALKASVAAAKDKTPSAGGARSGTKRSSAKKPVAKRAVAAKKPTTRKKASGG